MSMRGALTGLLLVVAALSGAWLWTQRKPDGLVGGPAGRADYVLKDFELVALDAQGKEAFTLRAPLLARQPATKTLDITTPLFVIPPGAGAQGEPWQVRAATGWVSAQGDELRLRGKVLATSTNATGQPLKIASEQLNVYPKAKRATSAVAVTLSQPGLTMTGRGLAADLANKHAILKSDVKGRYESTAR